MHVLNWNYIAGFFDGEGNIHIANTRMVRIFMYQNTVEVLEEILYFLEKYDLSCKIKLRRNRNCYQLQVLKRDSVEKFLSHIVDRCIVKKDKVKEAIEFYKNKPRRHTKPFLPEELDLIKTDLSSRRVAEKLGCSYKKILRIRHENGYYNLGK